MKIQRLTIFSTGCLIAGLMAMLAIGCDQPQTSQDLDSDTTGTTSDPYQTLKPPIAADGEIMETEEDHLEFTGKVLSATESRVTIESDDGTETIFVLDPQTTSVTQQGDSGKIADISENSKVVVVVDSPDQEPLQATEIRILETNNDSLMDNSEESEESENAPALDSDSENSSEDNTTSEATDADDDSENSSDTTE